MSYPLIAAKLFGETWCILPEVHESLCTQFRAHVAAKGAGMDPGDMQGAGDQVGPQRHPQVEVANGVALARVRGVLGKHLSGLDMMCGGYDVGLLQRQMANIAEDPKVHTAVLWFDSPGGMVVGIEAAANSIRAVSDAGKRTIAYTDAYCASAAYWLACACDEIHAEGSAVVGSISTIALGVDSSKNWEMQGLERKVFATGDLKAVGVPGKKWTEAEEAFVRSRGEAIDGDFKGYVKKRRGLDDAVMNGAHWYAKHAPKGLVDSTAFGSIEEVLEAAMLAKGK